MSSLVAYVSSDDDDEETSFTETEQPVTSTDHELPVDLPVPSKRSRLSLNLPAPQKQSRKQQRLLLQQRLQLARQGEDEEEEKEEKEEKEEISPPLEDGTSALKATAENEVADSTESTLSSAPSQLPLLQMEEAPGPAAPLSRDMLPPPPELLPQIMFEGKVVRPPPGLRPPPNLGRHLATQLPQQLAADPLLNMLTQFAKGGTQARFVDVNSDALVQQKYNRPAQDPLGLPGEEVFTGHVWGRKGQMVVAKHTNVGGGRHHITAMARSSSVNQEALLARAAAKRGNKDVSKSRYGW